jgi:hypothetical protein
MIAIRDSLRAKGEEKLANVVQSMINDLLATRFKNHPKIDSCVRFLAGVTNKQIPPTVKQIALIVGSPFPAVTFDSNGIVKLIMHLSYAQANKPEVLDLIERHL